MRRGQRDARQLYRAGRHDPAVQHPAGRDRHRRRRRWYLRLPAVRDPRRVRRRLDGRPHARICRQEDREPRSEARGAGDRGAALVHPRLLGAGGGAARRACRPAQQGAARLFGDPLRVQLGDRQQWLRLRWPQRRHAVLQWPARRRDVDRAVLYDRADPGDCRQPRRQEIHAGDRRLVPHHRPAVGRPADRNHPDPWRPHIPSQPRARADRRSSRDDPWPAVLKGTPMSNTKTASIFSADLVGPAIGQSFRKLDPRALIRNPVLFVTATIALLLTILLLLGGEGLSVGFQIQLVVWLWLTVLFGTFAEALAEGRGRAQASSLRAAKSDLTAKLVLPKDSGCEIVPAAKLQRGQVVLVETGDLIPADGEVIEGVASVNEAAITGESAPVIREAGGDRSAVTAGTRVISDQIKVRVTQEPGQGFLDRMIALVEGAERQKTPNEIALTILLVGLTIIFLIAVATIPSFAAYAHGSIPVSELAALLITLIPTTIAALLSAIGIAGMDRLVRFNVLAKSGRAVEAAGDVDVLLLDKTGTITIGDRHASEFRPLRGVGLDDLAEAALLASLADETPEGRSIVVLAQRDHAIETRALPEGAEIIPFTAQTRISGVRLEEALIQKGAVDAVLRANPTAAETAAATELRRITDEIARAGMTPLAVAKDGKLLGVIALKDVIKAGVRERFAELRRMGIRTVMITGDNPLTAASIAAEAGVDDFLAEATPEDKLALIRSEQQGGKLVAMCGDGTNDAS